MRSYLTKYSTLSTETSTLIADHVYPQRAHFFPEALQRTKTGMFFAPQILLDRVLNTDIVGYVRNSKGPGKTGFIFAAGSQTWNSGGVPLYEKHLTNSLAYSYKVELMTVTNIFGARVAGTLGATDYVSTDASTCASSLKVLMEARYLMQSHGFGRVIVLAFEDAITNTTLSFFGGSGANLLEGDTRQPSAFDKTNGGFYVGQGGCLAVFEREDFVLKNDSKIEAELLGAFTAAEHLSNPIGQREDGQGYTRAILGALGDRDPAEVALIKSHGTGTAINNKSERAALEGIFSDFIATSYKPRIGHTVGASGLLETCLLLDDIKRGEIPEIKNRTERDTRFISEPQPVPRGLMLSLAAGMGNVFSAALFNYHDYHKI